MNPTSYKPRTDHYTYGDTEEFRNKIRSEYPTCIVNVRKLTYNETGKNLSNTFFREYSCAEARDMEWPYSRELEFLGQVCRQNSLGDRFCTAHMSITFPPFKRSLQDELDKDMK